MKITEEQAKELTVDELKKALILDPPMSVGYILLEVLEDKMSLPDFIKFLEELEADNVHS